MMQSGQSIRYVSYGKHLYSAMAKIANGDGKFDVVLDYPPRCICCKASGKTPPCITIVHKVPYDSTGRQAHSWHEEESK